MGTSVLHACYLFLFYFSLSCYNIDFLHVSIHAKCIYTCPCTTFCWPEIHKCINQSILVAIFIVFTLYSILIEILLHSQYKHSTFVPFILLVMWYVSWIFTNTCIHVCIFFEEEKKTQLQFKFYSKFSLRLEWVIKKPALVLDFFNILNIQLFSFDLLNIK